MVLYSENEKSLSLNAVDLGSEALEAVKVFRN